MGYPSAELLQASARDLTGRHPLTVVTIPALLRAAREANASPTDLVPFGSKQEKAVLDDGFRVNDTKKPYLSVWNDPPVLVNDDYAGSTLQRLRTQDILGRAILHDDYSQSTKRRTRFGVQPQAGRVLVREQPLVNKISLAAWLGRHREFNSLTDLAAWFDEEFPTQGTDLAQLYVDGLSAMVSAVTEPFALMMPVDGRDIPHVLGLPDPEPPAAPPQSGGPVQAPEPDDADEDLGWTAEVCEYPLRDANVAQITETVLQDLADRHILLPDGENLVRRCVVALLVGHLVLQGPPGTGKTSLARALARGFGCEFVESTATSDWSPFHVVGGLRPNREGGLSPSHGKVVEAVLRCAAIVREEVNAQADAPNQEGAPTAQHQAAWLFIDEFNRADIDKAVGSLYTLLSSCDPAHLAGTPIDLWFEDEPGRRRLWSPARFRVIGAMNDLDTSFVSAISLGLTRRFQFVAVGVPSQPTSGDGLGEELRTALAGAHAWLDRTYGATLQVLTAEDVTASLGTQLACTQRLVDGLRHPQGAVAGWPVGTAQVVDILRVLLLSRAADPEVEAQVALDHAVADRLVPQMGMIDDVQRDSFVALLNDLQLPATTAVLGRLLDPHAVQ